MRVEIKQGQTLWQALNYNNKTIDRPCGGKGTCGLCKVALKEKGQVLACQFNVPGIYELEENEDKREMDFLGEKRLEDLAEYVSSLPDSSFENFIAIDIGTTTVAMAAVSSAGQVTYHNFINPQRQYGADVMSRIDFANSGKEDILSKLIKDAVCENISILDKAEFGGINRTHSMADKLIVSANTTMQHLYRGLSCQGLGEYPFSPVDISLYKEEQTTFLPGISTYVGADIVSGLYAIDILSEKKPVLFLDLGTNGEMALGFKDKLWVTSAPAGPAFEGSELASELYACQIMKVLASMRKDNIIDEYGTLIDEYFDIGFPVNKYIKINTDILITQDQIRELQMAKAAIRAGIDILLTRAGLSCRDISKVYLAGGMGLYTDASDAAYIGMLPADLMDCQFISPGNTSLKGAVKYAMSEKNFALSEMERIISLAEEIILAKDSDFEEIYINSMNF